ncbi:B12-binding domain-containing radical SAM protein [Actinoplanes awajinensis]|uniref:Uncharacterized protein n=1 Tax=Actinoplanes awajinensis subsp. mycoplanecinus TaxID=135947 RepID=A0A117MQ04_9ACTN|nr:radical SAM protein [Actinoplanes awajinensis]KUL29482.1 hypothetical protein ADL15_28115 [Actinoplanes awajinensis subsp. mycoplanecinus]
MIRGVWFFQPRTMAKANYANAGGKEQTWTPWWACYLAPAAVAAGLDAHLIDARTDGGWRARLQALGAGDVLAVTALTGAALRDALEASAIARDRGAYVVWGGPHATLFPAETLAQSPAHAVIPGTGGFPGLALLLARLTGTAGLPGPDEPRILVKGGDLVTVPRFGGHGTGLTIAAEDPDPWLDLITDWEPYVNADEAIDARTMSFVTSEGCLRRCTFCTEPQTSGRSWYTHPVERSVEVLAEMARRARAGGIKLHDPNFFHDPVRAMAFAERFRSRVGARWASSLHPADLQAMPDAQLRASADAGLCRVLIGMETPVPELIRLSNKRYDPAGIETMVRRLTAAGIRGMFTFIVGWPDADPGHYQQTIDCAFAIKHLDPRHQCEIHFLEPWPGTPIAKMLARRGLQHPTTLSGWADVDYYQAQIPGLHDPAYTEIIRAANRNLSPYIDA